MKDWLKKQHVKMNMCIYFMGFIIFLKLNH